MRDWQINLRWQIAWAVFAAGYSLVLPWLKTLETYYQRPVTTFMTVTGAILTTGTLGLFFQTQDREKAARTLLVALAATLVLLVGAINAGDAVTATITAIWCMLIAVSGWRAPASSDVAQRLFLLRTYSAVSFSTIAASVAIPTTFAAHFIPIWRENVTIGGTSIAGLTGVLCGFSAGDILLLNRYRIPLQFHSLLRRLAIGFVFFVLFVACGIVLAGNDITSRWHLASNRARFAGGLAAASGVAVFVVLVPFTLSLFRTYIPRTGGPWWRVVECTLTVAIGGTLGLLQAGALRLIATLMDAHISAKILLANEITNGMVIAIGFTAFLRMNSYLIASSLAELRDQCDVLESEEKTLPTHYLA